MTRSESGPQPRHLELGGTTGFDLTITYRLGKLRDLGILRGTWLDFGCAAGHYTERLIAHGVDRAIGVDVQFSLLLEATRRGAARVTYACGAAEALPLTASSFDGVLLNEVLEHVVDERKCLDEVRRVLRPGGYLALMSPNRWFPFEGHGMRFAGRSIPYPVPVLPWLPRSIGWRVMLARNYWPGELCALVRDAGLQVEHTSTVLPAFDVYSRHLDVPAVSTGLLRRYHRSISTIEKLPILRHMGVSTLVVARKPPA